MRILVTNDDGINAVGIKVLVEELMGFGDVTVVAPEKQQSAVSHAITLHKPLRLEKVAFNGLDVDAYTVNGTPSDAVVLAVLEVMGAEGAADLVVSGINLGPNIAEDVTYSGTVAGAMEGIMTGARAMSISLAAFENPDWRLPRRFIQSFFSKMDFLKLPSNTLLNVNIPNIDPDQCRGVQITRLGNRKFRDVIQKRTDPRGKEYYWIAGEKYFEDFSPGLDSTAVSKGFVSITPLTVDLTDRDRIPLLQSMIRELDPTGGNCP